MEARKNLNEDTKAKEAHKQSLEEVLPGSKKERDPDELSELDLDDIAGGLGINVQIP